jgi:D-alanyl-D-alanine carboxypeptidase
LTGLAAADATAAAATAPDDPSATSSPSESSSADALNAVLLDALGDRDGGVAVLWIRDGEATTTVIGDANVNGDPITVDTPFRTGDVSSMFIAALVMQLAEEGRVDLDEPLSTYLPDAVIGGDVTIRQLLSHQSGLPQIDRAPELLAESLADPAHVFTPDEVLGHLEDSFASAPGLVRQYAAVNFNLLGQLIEEIEGTDLNTVLRQRITEPLGLEVTAIDTGDAPIPDGLAAGWSGTPGLEGDPAQPYAAFASRFWPGVAFSTTGELATLLGGLFGGELVSADSLAEMTTLSPEGYGLGIGGFAAPDGTQLYYVGGGGAGPSTTTSRTDGYDSTAAYAPTTGDTLVVLTNNDQVDAGVITGRIIDELWSTSTSTDSTDG